jgi:Rieske Fe-S protein
LGEERVARKDFIRLGAVVGLGVAGSSVLTACGGSQQQGGGQQGNSKQKSQPSTTSPSVAKGDPIVQAAFIPPGMAFAFDLAENGDPALLVHLQNDTWAAYSAKCTHLGCEVSYQLDTRRLGCPCHGSQFNPAQGGAVVHGPAKKPLKEIKVRVEGGNVVRA